MTDTLSVSLHLLVYSPLVSPQAAMFHSFPKGATNFTSCIKLGILYTWVCPTL